MIGRDVEVVTVNDRFHRGVVVEHQRRPGVSVQMCRAGAGLDDAAIGGDVPLEHGERALCIDRVVERPDHVVVVDGRALDVLADRATRDRQRIQVQVLANAVHQPRQAAGVKEIFHQIGVAAGAHVGHDRHEPAEAIEVGETNIAPCTLGLGDDVDDRVGGATHGHRHGDCVLESGVGLDFGWREIFPDHIHDAPT